MTDDIVTRLRGELVVRLNGEPWITFDALPVLGEAADEIERLRILADGLYQELLRGGCCHDVTATQKWEEYEQAVRGG